ncbi:hypothetical protein [Burkholderia gladioli]|uniref:hypothetical protein n=1 Tax=Burkholderia gladioli TaxID=28095 RepID=UPI0016418DEA|nr:hypothetical protein [Burkholderia gladioli]MDN7724903.1 hypothetical protein [Burkholderia gladioli]
MKKVRVFKPARAEQKPSTRWHNRPRARRERVRINAERMVAAICAAEASRARDFADRVMAFSRFAD